MPQIRPAELRDLDSVVSLMQAHLLHARLPGGDDRRFVRETLFEAPWTSADLPSLVAEIDGEVVGFIGAQPRDMLLDGEPIRAVCCSHLVVAPAFHTRPVGPRLLRTLMSGPQDLTWSDSATAVVARMWRAFGGAVDPVRSLDWSLTLRPGRWAANVLDDVLHRRGVTRDTVPVAALPLHAFGRRLLPRAFPTAVPDISSTSVTAQEGAVAAAALQSGVALTSVWDECHLEVLVRLVARQGEVVHRVVRHREQLVGWYVAVQRNDLIRVLAMRSRQHTTDAVLQAIVADANTRRASTLTGRLEPMLIDALQPRMPALGFARRPVVHSNRPAVTAALLTSAATPQRLDGEWWIT